MKVSNNEDKIGLLIQFDESRSVLLIDSKRIESCRTSQLLKIQRRMERIIQKQGFPFFKLFPHTQPFEMLICFVREFDLHTVEVQTVLQACRLFPHQNTRP